MFFEEHTKIKNFRGLSLEGLKALKCIDIDVSQYKQIKRLKILFSRNYCAKKGIEFLVEGFEKYLGGLEEICLNLSK